MYLFLCANIMFLLSNLKSFQDQSFIDLQRKKFYEYLVSIYGDQKGYDKYQNLSKLIKVNENGKIKYILEKQDMDKILDTDNIYQNQKNSNNQNKDKELQNLLNKIKKDKQQTIQSQLEQDKKQLKEMLNILDKSDFSQQNIDTYNQASIQLKKIENQLENMNQLSNRKIIQREVDQNSKFVNKIFQNLNELKNQEQLKENKNQCQTFQIIDPIKNIIKKNNKQFIDIPKDAFMPWEVDIWKIKNYEFIQPDFPIATNSNYQYQILYYLPIKDCEYLNSKSLVKTQNLYQPQIVLTSVNYQIPQKHTFHKVKLFNDQTKEIEIFHLKLNKIQKIEFEDINKQKQKNKKWKNFKNQQQQQQHLKIDNNFQILYPTILHQLIIPYDVIGAWNSLDPLQYLIYNIKLPVLQQNYKEFQYKPFYYIKFSNLFPKFTDKVLEKILLPVYILTKSSEFKFQDFPEFLEIPVIKNQIIIS